MEIDRDLSINIFRVYQEALTNVTRYAQATIVEVSVEEAEGYFQLKVTDNGVGFSIEEAKTKKTLGLIGMRERALLFQGELTIASMVSMGTVITVKIPLKSTSHEIFNS